MSLSAAIRLSLLSGVALALLCGPFLIAWQFGFDPALGHRWFNLIYPPWRVWDWWQAWGRAEPYRSLFVKGIQFSAIVVLVPPFIVQFIRINYPGKLNDHESKSGLGTAWQLIVRTRRIFPWGRNGVVLGKRHGFTFRDRGDGHVLILGPARSAKGVGHVMPTVLSHRGSMIVLDPKHEISGASWRWRRSLGPAYVLDPTSRDGPSFNPLAELRRGINFIGDCQTAGHMLVVPKGEGQNVGQDHIWDDAAATLLSTLIYHSITAGNGTLAQVYDTLRGIRRGILPRTSDRFVSERMEELDRQTDRIKDSILFTATTALEFLIDPVVRNATECSDFRASDLMAGCYPTTIYIAAPLSGLPRLRPWMRLVLQALWVPLMDHASHTSDGREKLRPVLCLLDELPQLRNMEIVEQVMVAGAGQGLRCMIVCQDSDQIMRHYGERQAIISNCSTIALTPGFSKNSLETAQRWGGEHNVMTGSRQIAMRGFGGMSESEHQRHVLNPRSMFMRARKEVLIFTLGCAPTYLRKVRYYRDLAYLGRHDPPNTRLTYKPRPTTPTGQPPWLIHN